MSILKLAYIHMSLVSFHTIYLITSNSYSMYYYLHFVWLMISLSSFYAEYDLDGSQREVQNARWSAQVPDCKTERKGFSLKVSLPNHQIQELQIARTSPARDCSIGTVTRGAIVQQQLQLSHNISPLTSTLMWVPPFVTGEKHIKVHGLLASG